MHYNRNRINSNYYNAYKEEMSVVKKTSFPLYAKIGLSILSVGIIATLYINSTVSTPKSQPIIVQVNEEPPKIIFPENLQPKNPQLRNSNSQTLAQIKLNATDTEAGKTADIDHIQISQEEITLIIETIMSQMNPEKEETKLTEQLQKAENYPRTTKTLKENNHYNKVVLSNNTPLSNPVEDNQQELRNKIDTLLSNTETEHSSEYEGTIKQEVTVRSNEMRIIVVKRGDTLSKIAKRAYGDIYAYPKIFSANPEVLKNPNEIFVGQKLRIPS